MDLDDFSFMQAALSEAQKGFEKGEVPVGAVLVYRQQIIAAAFNQVEVLVDATSHAEMLCIRKGASILGNWRLIDCTLYTTLEPCPMCAGAMISSRIKRVVWGSPDIRQGAGHLLKAPHPIHTVDVTEGILAEESSLLLKTFFKEQRQWKKSLTN